MTDRPYDRFHVVLVEPHDSRNVGSTARAMMNLGFRNLHLVAPPSYRREQAAVTACWAGPLLDGLQIHARLEDALAGMEEVVGFSGRAARDRPHHAVLPQWAADLAERPQLPVTALVFGPEDNGLRQEHLDRCRWVVRIPSAAACPSFNLAQAALLVLYEITRVLPAAAEAPAAVEPRPTENDRLQLDRLADAVMRESGFLRQGTPSHVPGTVRNLLRRLDADRQEMGILLGLFGRIRTALGRQKAAEEDGHG